MNLKKNGRCLFNLLKAYSTISYIDDRVSNYVINILQNYFKIESEMNFSCSEWVITMIDHIIVIGCIRFLE